MHRNVFNASFWSSYWQTLLLWNVSPCVVMHVFSPSLKGRQFINPCFANVSPLVTPFFIFSLRSALRCLLSVTQCTKTHVVAFGKFNYTSSKWGFNPFSCCHRHRLADNDSLGITCRVSWRFTFGWSWWLLDEPFWRSATKLMVFVY